jgi:CheY-like chemotaxis protein
MDKMLRRVIGEQVEMESLFAPGLWPVKMDPTQIEQIVVNLAVNARDAMPDGGKLTIETTNVVFDQQYAAEHIDAQPGEYVMLAISDTGTGMSEEVKARIFEPFFTTKEVGKGTGLGLATVHGIVKQSGGYIWVYSEQSKIPGSGGTTFKIYLPRAEGTPTPLTRPDLARNIPGGNETILVVEDHAEVRDLVRRALQPQGYALLEAKDGHEALRLVAEYSGSVDLLLTDVVMPGMNGKSLVDEFAIIQPKAKVLFMSGYTEAAIADYGVADPAIAFLQKPFSPIALARTVRDMLDN